MRFVLVSNYINHHQIPLCREIMNIIGEGNFTFLETQPMEAERLAMGWGRDMGDLSFVMQYDKDSYAALKLIAEADVVLLGWTLSSKVMDACLERVSEGKALIRMSERIYREGRWKAISPRGLAAKYHEHIKYRKDNLYMLCSGAYTAGDFRLIHAYPDKLLKWGYFPKFEEVPVKDGYKDQEEGKLGDNIDAKIKCVGNSAASLAYRPVNILWAGRFMRGVKHPEYALHLAGALKKADIPFSLRMVGGGEMKDELEAYINENDLGANVKMMGFLPPEKVRELMKTADIYLFTSNHLEGWGAVVNEAMNSRCAVLAGEGAGAVPYLIKDGINGLTFKGENEAEFIAKGVKLAADRKLILALGNAAYETIRDEWNPHTAAARLVDLAGSLVNGAAYTPPQTGPLSRA
ncbi:glycosyltransferase family 4 protein [Butyrivibrio sp. MC2013]|uniref:glycosyltransferase family 4 protein n=1 Tax=Butyrivibrio sp. MC2013 TaxID=1280686 RepID=UPI000415D55A|nr:glycosyltransferase family 4 protein [Butyrivibrio sp. MC2013]